MWLQNLCGFHVSVLHKLLGTPHIKFLPWLWLRLQFMRPDLRWSFLKTLSIKQIPMRGFPALSAVNYVLKFPSGVTWSCGFIFGLSRAFSSKHSVYSIISSVHGNWSLISYPAFSPSSILFFWCKTFLARMNGSWRIVPKYGAHEIM